MRKSLVYLGNFLFLAALGGGLLALNQARVLRAQTVSFQNSNASCEQENVLCVSAGNPIFCREAMSIACKNVTGGADFNGDGFFDCAAATSFFPNTTGGNLDVSVLINSGNTGPCTGGVVDQLDPAQDYSLAFPDASSFPTQTDLGSIVVGNIGGGFFDDLAVPSAQNSISPSSNAMVSAFSVAGGGFGPAGAAPASTATAAWNPVSNQVVGSPSFNGQRNDALLDCDGNGTLDAAIAGGDSGTDFYTLNIMRNDGSALQDVVPGEDFDTTIPFDTSSPNPIMNVAVADFDGGNGPDVAVAVSSNFGTPSDIIAVCFNNGNCGYTCNQVVDLDAIFPGQIPRMSSIAAGDFDADGNSDLVITTPELDNSPGNEIGIHFFMGDGAGNFATPGIHVPYNPSLTGGRPFVLATGFFNNDDAEDVALSYDGGRSDSNVGVFVMDAARAVTTTTLTYAGTNFVDEGGGIDAVDLDNQGCDDIVSLGTELIDRGTFIDTERHAYVFLNEVEQMSAIAGADQTADLNTPVAIAGAACTLSPADPGAVVAQAWTLTPATGATLSGADTLTPTFTATAAGSYTLTLTCHSRCTGDTTDTKVVTVAGPVPPPIVGDTQGGCLASLAPGGHFPAKGFYALFLLLPACFALRRLSRKGATALMVVLLLTVPALSAHALTTRFSVNTFEPTVDDSEYFTKVGFYFGDAHQPYELGDTSFNRVGDPGLRLDAPQEDVTVFFL